MRLIVDLHIHSRYTKATSRDMDLERLCLWARRKGVHILATGDATHPAWLQELAEKLRPAEEGFFCLREDLEAPLRQLSPRSNRDHEIRFLLSTEVICVFPHEGTTQRIRILLFFPGFEETRRLNEALAPFGDLHAEGRPQIRLSPRELVGIIRQISSRIHIVPSQILAPWFSLLGVRSHFTSVEACFGETSSSLLGLEAGASIDTAALRRIKSLDRYPILKASNAHSPPRIGREAIELDAERDYDSLFEAIQSHDPRRFLGTLETWPQEEKYYNDGHLLCRIRLDAEEALQRRSLCPACKKPLTLGVSTRAASLADRKLPLPAFPPAQKLLPLEQILAQLLQSSPRSKRIQKKYLSLLDILGDEIFILRATPREEIAKLDIPLLDEAIHRIRQGDVIIEHGYDGQPGQIRIFREDDALLPQQDLFPGFSFRPPPPNQLMLFDPTSPAIWRKNAPPLPEQIDLFATTQAEQEEVSTHTTPHPTEHTTPHPTEEKTHPPTTPLDLTPHDEQEEAAFALSPLNKPSLAHSFLPTASALPRFDSLQRFIDPLTLPLPKLSPPPSQKEAHLLAQLQEFVSHIEAIKERRPLPALSLPPHPRLTTNAHSAESITQETQALAPLAEKTDAPSISTPTSTAIPITPSSLASPPRLILSRLNTEQRGAVKHWGSPLQIVAGAGTGKTYTLIHRIAYLIANRTLDSSQILAFVPSEQAARELRDHLQALVGSRHHLTITTFHRFCLELLAGEDRLPHLLSDLERGALLEQLAQELRIPLSPQMLAETQQALSLAKQQALSPEEAREAIPDANDRFVELFALYQQRLHQHRLIDLDDLLRESVDHLAQDKLLRQQLQMRFRSIHVDDYQDISSAQHQLLRLLVSEETDLCVAGDPDQAIASGWGADLHHFHQFRTDFTNPKQKTQRYHFWRSYRSPALLLEAAHLLIATQPDPQRIQTEPTKHTPQKQIPLLVFDDPQDEARGIARQIQALLACRQGGPLHPLPEDQPRPIRLGDIAIFYRLPQQLPPLRQALEEAGLPYWFHAREEQATRNELRALLAWLRMTHAPKGDWFALESLLHLSPDWDASWTPPLLGFLEKAFPSMLDALDSLSSKEAPPALQSLFPSLAQSHAPTLLRRIRQRLHALHKLLKQPPHDQAAQILDLLFAEIERAPFNPSPQMRASLRSYLYEKARESRRIRHLFQSLLLEQQPALPPQGLHQIKLLALPSIKGLSFPIVFIAGCHDHLIPPRHVHQQTERLDEELRMLYTALHRAQRSLFLCYTRHPQRIPHRSSSLAPSVPISRFLETLAPFLLLHPFHEPLALDL